MIDVVPPQTDKIVMFFGLSKTFCIAMTLWFFIFLFCPFAYNKYKVAKNGQ